MAAINSSLLYKNPLARACRYTGSSLITKKTPNKNKKAPVCQTSLSEGLSVQAEKAQRLRKYHPIMLLSDDGHAASTTLNLSMQSVLQFVVVDCRFAVDFWRIFPL